MTLKDDSDFYSILEIFTMDVATFSRLFRPVAQRFFTKELDVAILRCYYETLKHLSPEQLERACQWAIITQDMFPSPLKMIQSLGGNTDAIWSDLLKKSAQLSAVRYDIDKFRRLDRQLKAELSPNVALFLQENNISLLNLGDRSEGDLIYLKKTLNSYLVNNFQIETVTQLLKDTTDNNRTLQNGCSLN